jgi:prepilin-type processing-associated H-X9-DG protein/prepilin-type N-terminal cleavage/methylation domain-containing protein
MSASRRAFRPCRVPVLHHPAPRRRRSCAARPAASGFSLVEILVVIGIIAVLIGMLLPVLSRARESANRTKCLSNMRQLAIAFTMYLNESKGRFPRPAQLRRPEPEDWIYFQPGRDPSQGALARYVARPFNAAVYRCPSDDVESHRWIELDALGGTARYLFSYAVNEAICRIFAHGPTLRLGQIRNPSEKILIIDESGTTIDDGCWAWQSGHPPGAGMNVLSNRHDRRSERSENPNFGRGNVAFVDGHVEFLGRSDSFDARFYDPSVR